MLVLKRLCILPVLLGWFLLLVGVIPMMLVALMVWCSGKDGADLLDSYIGFVIDDYWETYADWAS